MARRKLDYFSQFFVNQARRSDRPQSQKIQKRHLLVIVFWKIPVYMIFIFPFYNRYL